MIANITTVLTGLFDAISTMLTPTASEGGLVAGEVAGIAALFAVPVVIGVVKKVKGLVKSTK